MFPPSGLRFVSQPPFHAFSAFRLRQKKLSFSFQTVSCFLLCNFGNAFEPKRLFQNFVAIFKKQPTVCRQSGQS